MTQLDEIIKRCIDGNRGAQTSLYNLFSSKMFGVCLRYSRDSSEAEDILQEGFVRVFTKLEQYEFKGSFEGWVRRIMVNTALEKIRKNDHLYTTEDLRHHESKEGVEETLSSIAAADLLQLIQELPPRYRMVFNMFAIEGYSHTEIGEMMNISEGTSKSNLSRARVILQKKVNENYGFKTRVVNPIYETGE